MDDYNENVSWPSGARKSVKMLTSESISRNNHRIKNTQPNSMKLVSFFSKEFLSDKPKTRDALRVHSTKNLPFRYFLEHPVYRYPLQTIFTKMTNAVYNVPS